MLQTFSLPGSGSPQALVLSQLNLHEASSLHSNRRLLKRWHSDEAERQGENDEIFLHGRKSPFSFH